MEDSSEICAFYKEATVLITGGTGFLGKVLIEKLLRSTDVTTIYILIRAKKGKSVQRRFEELFNCEIFDRMKTACPKFEHRIKPIAGDCSISGLGLTILDREKLISEVNVLFHVAATVKFDENLKRAFNINVNGTKDLIYLAKQMANLKSFIHVSTAYSNCPLTAIDEIFYPFPYSYGEVEAVIEKVNEYEVAEITSRILGQWPNTYTFTKALAESLIKNQGSELPIGIFRPAAVISSYRDPVPGWTDHFNGPGGVAAAAASGVMRTLRCGRDVVADLVPVDACVAGLIAVGWDVAQRKKRQWDEPLTNLRPEEMVPIYNYVSSPENPITWNEFTQYTLSYGRKYPVRNAQWAPFMILTPNVMTYMILKVFLHLIPGMFIDGLSAVFGKRPKMLRVYNKVHKLSNTVSYFCVRTWNFSNCNTQKLWLRLNRTDRELFPMSITTVHWLIYVRNYIKGVRAYLLKDPECTLQAARRKAVVLDVINFFVIVCMVFGIIGFISCTLGKAYSIIS